LLLLWSCGAWGAPPVTIRGKVIDLKTGEALSKALVSIRSQQIEAVSDNAGRFVLADVQPGEVELYISTVGYGLFKKTIEVPAGADMEVELAVGQDALKHTEKLTVSANPFDPVEPATAAQQTIEGVEFKNLSSMFGDPLRAIQSLPGVAASDDYYAEFAYRGAGSGNIAFYLDGVLMRDPFHSAQQVTGLGSVSLLSSDIIESITLLGDGFPARYGDRTAAVLDVETRDPGRDKPSLRISMDCFQAWVTAEGPLGRKKQASWLVTARKSYLQYLMNRTGSDGLSIAFYDLEGKLTYDPAPNHRLSLLAIHGPMNVNAIYNANTVTEQVQSAADVAGVSWQWTPRPSALLRTAVSFDRESGRNQLNQADLLRSTTEDYAVRHDAAIQLTPHFALDAGVEARRTQEDYVSHNAWDVTMGMPQVTPFPLAQFRTAAWRYGAYIQNVWSAKGGRLMVTAGGRFDHLSYTGQNAWSPRASISFALTPKTKILASYGQYAQFPELEQLLGDFRNPALRAERSTQYSLGFERRLAERVQFKVEAYDRQEREKPFSADTEWRLVNGVAVAPVYGLVLANSVRGYSRGVELSLRRASANRLSGWMSYSFGHARYRDAATNISFDGDYDQRHVVNAFTSYRISKTVSLSGKYRYESNFPVVGFYNGNPAADWNTEHFTLSSQRNQLRVPFYSRLDLRVNKAHYFKRSKITLYAELDNMLNRTHWRYFNLAWYNYQTGQAWLQRDKLLPILPSGGFTIEF
jgi:hypothetical protein